MPDILDPRTFRVCACLGPDQCSDDECPTRKKYLALTEEERDARYTRPTQTR